MKYTLPAAILLIVILGATYWLLAHRDAEAPTDGTEVSGQPAPSDARDLPPSPETAEADYTGLTEVEAETLASENDVMFRVIERDGAMLPTTRDYRPGRINATVENGVVVSYIVEGSDVEEGGNKQGDPNANKYDFSEPSEPDITAEGAHGEIIGMTVADAELYAKANEVAFRIGSVDGEARPVTMDYQPGRITASVVDGVIIDYSVE